jgi:hypothetical protein
MAMKKGPVHPGHFAQAVRLIIAIFYGLAVSSPSWAAFGDDAEKPKAEFTRQADRIAAKLIPRGKSTSVRIEFQTPDAKLLDVEGVDFDAAGQKGLDAKDFRSALFAVKAGGLSPGGEIQVSFSSNYFTQATELWVLNRTLKTPWMNANAEHIERPNRVQELVVTVKDGGPFDRDGTVNGEITLVAGPKDSFWGYALGTLLIRFFGIFLVLGVLMGGMLLAGLVFQRLGRRAEASKAAPALPPGAEGLEEVADAVAPETATAIGVALHLHLSALRAAAVLNLERSDGSSWALQGRSQIMRDRLRAYDRAGRT